MLGILKTWGSRNYGIVQVRTDNRIESFFLHCSQVVYCEPQEIHTGCWISFEVDQNSPRMAGQFLKCLRAHVFEPSPAAPLSVIDALSGKDGVL